MNNQLQMDNYVTLNQNGKHIQINRIREGDEIENQRMRIFKEKKFIPQMNTSELTIITSGHYSKWPRMSERCWSQRSWPRLGYSNIN